MRSQVFLFTASLLFIFLTHPHIGIRDEDAFAYLIGADSLRLGLGFTEVSGSPIKPWPVAYSFLLSQFPNSILAAQWINSLCFALSTTLLFALFRQFHWPALAALSGTVFWAASFFRTIASNSSPDILTYALFLGGIFFLAHRKALALMLLILATPLKGLGFLFLPAVVIYLRSRRYLWALIPWLLVSLWTGQHYLKHFISFYPSGKNTTLPFSERLFVFLQSPYWVLRESLWGWYGSLRHPGILLACFALLTIAYFCARTLRKQNSLWKLGAFYLLPLHALPILFGLPIHLRHSAYGWILLMMSFVPKGTRSTPWALLALGCLLFASVNASIVPSIGGNSADLRATAKSVAPSLPQGSIATNSYKILDLYERRPSFQTENPETTARWYLRFLNANPDAIATILLPVSLSPQIWCPTWKVPNAELLEPCSHFDKR